MLCSWFSRVIRKHKWDGLGVWTCVKFILLNGWVHLTGRCGCRKSEVNCPDCDMLFDFCGELSTGPKYDDETIRHITRCGGGVGGTSDGDPM